MNLRGRDEQLGFLNFPPKSGQRWGKRFNGMRTVSRER
jgi:hypothetical protein